MSARAAQKASQKLRLQVQKSLKTFLPAAYAGKTASRLANVRAKANAAARCVPVKREPCSARLSLRV